MTNSNSRLELGTLENWLWEAACVIRGPIDAPKFKDYILPLIFLKRLSDVFEDDLQQLGNTAKYVDADELEVANSVIRGRVLSSNKWNAEGAQAVYLAYSPVVPAPQRDVITPEATPGARMVSPWHRSWQCFHPVKGEHVIDFRLSLLVRPR